MMIFTKRDIAFILRENSKWPFLIVETNQSKYKGCKYKIQQSDWKARIIRNGKSVYYYWGSVSLTDDTYTTFKNLDSPRYPHRDHFGKEICQNNLIFNNGNLWKVEIVTFDYLYLSEFTLKDNDGFNCRNNYHNDYGMCKFHSQYKMGRTAPYYRLSKDASWRFSLIDNPFDILRIADAN